jgi:putative transposase
MRAYVILPDHLHCIWTLPNDDVDFSIRWRLIKSYFTRDCAEHSNDISSKSRKHKKEKCIWQRRFWEHVIRDENDFVQHVDYIHYNPVKHGYVTDPADWLNSSFNFYKSKGVYLKGWGCDAAIREHDLRE